MSNVVQPTHSAFAPAPAHHSALDGHNNGLHGQPSRFGGLGNHPQRATVFLRPIADPGALGWSGFAIGTFIVYSVFFTLWGSFCALSPRAHR